MVSSGGHTVLLGQILKGNVHYRVLETDTLETKFEWTREEGSDSPRIIALSDKELLGFRDIRSGEKPIGLNTEREAFVRPLGGSWHPLNTTLDVSNRGLMSQGFHPTQLAFLSDTVLVGVHRKTSERDGSIVELESDGTVLSRPLISKLQDRTTLSGPVAVSAGGHYFAVGFEHQPWLSHLLLDVMTMDITFWPDDSLFWSGRPLARNLWPKFPSARKCAQFLSRLTILPPSLISLVQNCRFCESTRMLTIRTVSSLWDIGANCGAGQISTIKSA